MFTHSEAIEVLISISNIKRSVNENLKEFNLKKYISNKSKLYNNQEQELNLFIQFKFLYLFDLSKMEGHFSNEELNPFLILEKKPYYTKNIILLNYPVQELENRYAPLFFLNNFLEEEKILNEIKDLEKNVAIVICDQSIQKILLIFGLLFFNSKNNSILVKSNENSDDYVHFQGEFKNIKKNEKKNLQGSAFFNNGVFIRKMSLYSSFLLRRKNENDLYEKKLVFYANDLKFECFLVAHILD
jgi:hypothetical protein